MGLCIGGPLDGQEHEAFGEHADALLGGGPLRYQPATLILPALHDARIGYAYPLWLAPGWAVRVCHDGPVPVCIATHPLNGERRYLLATAAECEDASPWASMAWSQVHVDAADYAAQYQCDWEAPSRERSQGIGPSPEAVGYGPLVEGDATIEEMWAKMAALGIARG